MRIGIIAEGFSDATVIRAIVNKLVPVNDGIRLLRPQERFDETDLQEMNFSSWQLVLDSCKDEDLLSGFFEDIDGDAIIIVHIDTAERGQKGFDIVEPQRGKDIDFVAYSESLREKVCAKMETLIPEKFRQRIAYAIAIEETDAWLIPLFEHSNRDTSSHVNAKETLSKLIGKDKKLQRKYVDTHRKMLDYQKLGKGLMKELQQARGRNKSLDLFCFDIERTKNEESLHEE